MKRLALALFIAGMVAVFLLGCEKDDICPEDSVTTPLLVITFHDRNDSEARKEVSFLSVIGKDQDAPITGIDSIATDSIAIPLKVFENESVFAFTRHTEEISESGDTLRINNADTLTFQYQTEQIFISRACGFVTNFSGLTAIRDQADTNRWISSLEVINPTVENQSAAHVKIYH
ncbi:hypothetical protein ED312_13245 [Sinomicrobium pectinilyticum]|uniref:Lipoprotein n=1 Tax=Sinomicrobium pectinilyticum TaxID=1084421 RepID=A0A3N0EB12_SINP1|nr:DUF6452 family protein [Sinomicrobium pectinilyticum]RNL84939.1 hypothetical protein ED312_13245 [Sinomicrobium pectinilyticum]